MALTPKQIIGQIRYEFDLWGTDGIRKIPDDMVVDYMQDAEYYLLHSLVDDALSEETETNSDTGAASGVSTLPTDVVRYISIKIGPTSGSQVTAAIINPDENRRTSDDSFLAQANTDPVYWFENGGLSYTPSSADDTVIYSYIEEPTATIAFPSTGSDFADNLHPLIAEYCKMKVAEHLNDSRYTSHRAALEDEINKINTQVLGDTNIVKSE